MSLSKKSHTSKLDHVFQMTKPCGMGLVLILHVIAKVKALGRRDIAMFEIQNTKHTVIEHHHTKHNSFLSLNTIVIARTC